MNAPTALEDRLRRGLHAAADALPPASPQPRRGRPRASRKRWVAGGIATAAAVAAVVGAVVVGGRQGEQPSVELEATTPQEGTTADSPASPGSPDPVVAATNGMVPGQAVVVGNELRTYGPDGGQTGTLSLAPLDDVQAASSDLAGGWVACGMTSVAAADAAATSGTTTTTVPADEPVGGISDPLIWYPADRAPIALEEASPVCMASAVRVVDTPEGPTAVYSAFGSAGFSFRAVVLATGEDRELSIPLDPTGFYASSASPGRIIVHSDEHGLQLFDLTTGEDLPVAAIDLASPGHVSDIALSPDAASLAVIVGEVAGPSDLVVYDLATGAELYRETFPLLATEGAELSYDGTKVAVGNYYDGHDDVVYPPVTVIDLATGARHTIDVYGLVL
jgi:hypothetical protein